MASRSHPAAALAPALALALTSGLGAASGAGCGGGASVATMVVTGPFTEEHASAFENGIDYIDDPQILEGTWLRSWEEDIDRRVSLSDAIALVTITTFREDIDLDRRQTYRLLAHVDRRRHGEPPDELALVARPSDAGYGTVRGNEERILNRQFIAFLKWAEEDGRVVARWHLSPATDRIVRRVNTLVERRHTPAEGRRRVIVVDHGESTEGTERDVED